MSPPAAAVNCQHENLYVFCKLSVSLYPPWIISNHTHNVLCSTLVTCTYNKFFPIPKVNRSEIELYFWNVHMQKLSWFFFGPLYSQRYPKIYCIKSNCFSHTHTDSSATGTFVSTRVLSHFYSPTPTFTKIVLHWNIFREKKPIYVVACKKNKKYNLGMSNFLVHVMCVRVYSSSSVIIIIITNNRYQKLSTLSFSLWPFMYVNWKALLIVSH